jgi:hypothetical protein
VDVEKLVNQQNIYGTPRALLPGAADRWNSGVLSRKKKWTSEI